MRFHNFALVAAAGAIKFSFLERKKAIKKGVVGGQSYEKAVDACCACMKSKNNWKKNAYTNLSSVAVSPHSGSSCV